MDYGHVDLNPNLTDEKKMSLALVQARRAAHCGGHPFKGTYDVAKCRAVGCPNRKNCAFERAQEAARVHAEAKVNVDKAAAAT